MKKLPKIAVKNEQPKKDDQNTKTEKVKEAESKSGKNSMQDKSKSLVKDITEKMAKLDAESKAGKNTIETFKDIASKIKEMEEEKEVNHFNFKIQTLYPETPKAIGVKGIVAASKVSAPITKS